jgi:hypothetical protein
VALDERFHETNPLRPGSGVLQNPRVSRVAYDSNLGNARLVPFDITQPTLLNHRAALSRKGRGLYYGHRVRGWSIKLQPQLPDQRGPLRLLAFEVGGVFFRHTGLWVGPFLDEALAHLFRLDDAAQLGVEPLDDRTRRAGRCRHAVVETSLEPRQAGFRRCGHVGEDRRAFGSGNGEGSQRARLDVADRRRDRVEGERAAYLPDTCS